MRIPEIREELLEIADDLYQSSQPGSRLRERANRIAELAAETRRRPPVRKATPRRRRMTRLLVLLIRDYANKHPGLDHMAIAAKFNVNPGRVSEVLAGKRD